MDRGQRGPALQRGTSTPPPLLRAADRDLLVTARVLLREENFWFAWSDEESIRLGCRESIDREPGVWTFAVSRPSAHHVLATACRSGDGRRLARGVEPVRATLR